MVLYLSRDKLSYFQSYKNYFIAIYLVFLGFPVADLVIMNFSDQTLLRSASEIFVTSAGSIAILWGLVATKLYMYPEPLSFKRIFSSPFRPIFLIFAVYLVPMIAIIAFVWSDPYLAFSGNPQALGVLEGEPVHSPAVGTFLVALGIIVIIAFNSYPLAILSKRGTLVKDSDARSALRTIAFVFGLIAATLFLGVGVASIGYSFVGLTDFFSVVLIIVAVHAFRKPTFLKSFLGVVPSLQSTPAASHYDQTILIYGPESEKFSSIAKYIVDGVNQKERVIFFHNGDITLATEGLLKQGVDVKRLMLKGSLRMPSLGTAYQSRVKLDDTPLEMVQELAAEANALGNEGLRVILDYDDFVVRPVRQFVKHLTDPRWTTPDHRLHVLMAFDALAFRGEEASLAELEKMVRTLDLAEARDTFSGKVGLSRDEIDGRKLLLEYDPQWDYQGVFRSVLAEAASNFERTVTFTRKDSPIYSIVSRQPAAKIFVLTSRVSYPKVESENLFLLPSYDTSLLLDALNKTIEAYAGSSFTIIFDNISHFVFTIGPERTYALVRQALELMISNKITAFFSINSKTHDAKIMSTFENMFDIELVCEMGSTVPQIKRKIAAVS